MKREGTKEGGRQKGRVKIKEGCVFVAVFGVVESQMEPT